MKSTKPGKKINEAKSSQRNPQSFELQDPFEPHLTSNKRSLQVAVSSGKAERSSPSSVNTRKMEPALRRRIMSSIRKTNTVPEVVLRRALYAAGLRGWRCHQRLPGTP